MPWRSGLLLILIMVLPVEAYILESDKVGNLIKWPTEKKVFSVYLSDDLPVDREFALSTIDDAFESLNIGIGISFVYDNEDALSDIVITQKEFEETSNGFHQAAITSLEYSDLKIKKARIFLNKDFGFSEEKSLKNYIGNVISHELGHALGLAHSPVTSSTMYPYLNPGQYNFSKDDILGLKKLFTQSEAGGVIKGSVKSYEGGGSLLAATSAVISSSYNKASAPFSPKASSQSFRNAKSSRRKRATAVPLHAWAAANAEAKLSRSPALDPKQHVQQAKGPAASPRNASFRALRLSSAVRCGLMPAGCHCVAAMVRAMTDNKRMQRVCAALRRRYRSLRRRCRVLEAGRYSAAWQRCGSDTDACAVLAAV